MPAAFPPEPRVVVVCMGALACALGCAPPPAAAARGAAPPEEGVMIAVSFVDAVIAPSHDDGLAWDSTHVVPELVRADLRVARTGRDGYAHVVDMLAAHDGEPWGKPDPVGAVTWMVSPACQRETRILPARRDTYRPSWAPGVTFRHVPLDRATRFRVVLEDDDAPGPSELVGAVDVSYAALAEALALDGAVHRVDVGDQGQAVYFVGIRVRRE